MPDVTVAQRCLEKILPKNCVVATRNELVTLDNVFRRECAFMHFCGHLFPGDKLNEQLDIRYMTRKNFCMGK